MLIYDEIEDARWKIREQRSYDGKIKSAGKTVEQVAAEITKKLDEFIIDPKVTVTLDKAMATRYAVMGSVAAPGVRVMDRKVSVYEAILDAGGVSKTGDK